MKPKLCRKPYIAFCVGSSGQVPVDPLACGPPLVQVDLFVVVRVAADV